MRKLFDYDIVYASFWLTVAIVIFFFPVMLGWQSLTEAVPTFYSQPSPDPSVKTLWQVDGGWHTTGVIPLTKAAVQMIKAGIPPLWASYSGGGGEPLLVSNPVNIYYPLRLAFFSLWDSTRAFDWYFILRFFIAGLGMFFYLRIIGLRRIVALWGGIAYAFTGYFILYLTYPFLDIDALLPWTLWVIERYCRKKNLGAAALIGFFLAMTIIIGQPQSTIIAFMLAALYFAWRIIAQDKIGRQLLRPLYHVLFALFVAFLVASPFIADFLTNYFEGATVPDWLTKGGAHFPPAQLLHFIVTPTMTPEIAAAGHLFDRFYLIIPYIGFSVLILFLLGFFLKNRPPQLAPLWIWTAFVILKNAGFPLVQWIGHLPILNQVGWYKAYGPMAGAMVICAAIAFERLLREENGGAIRWRGFYKLIAAIPLVFVAAYAFAKNAFLTAYVPSFDFFNRQPEMIEKATALLEGLPQKVQEFALFVLQNNGWYFTLLWFAEAIVFGGIALVIIWRLRHKRRWAALAMVIFTTFELWFYMPKIRDGFRYIDPYKEIPPYVAFLQNKFAEDGVSRIFPLGDVFQGNIGELHKILKAQNSSAIKPRRYLLFLPDKILRNDPLVGKIDPDRLSDVPTKFFDAFNVRYLISEKPLSESWLKLIYDKDMKIYENTEALPKAYVSFQKESAAAPEEARSIFYGAPFDPHNAVILEDQNAITLPSAEDSLSYVRAAVLRYESNEIELKTATDRDGILVLTDTFYSGWRAYLDREKVPIYPANVLFRGIYLPRGYHTIKFIYEPWWFWPSVVVSLGTIAGIIILLAYPAVKNRRAQAG